MGLILAAQLGTEKESDPADVHDCSHLDGDGVGRDTGTCGSDTPCRRGRAIMAREAEVTRRAGSGTR